MELMRRMTLPVPKPPVFSENILEYPKWVSAFDALIEDEAVKPGHKLFYLGEYTSGAAQKMINGLLGLQTEDAYKRARKILQDRFGDPFKIYEAYHERLKAWPVCTKSAEIQEFSDFLVTTQETMKTVKYLREYNTFSAIQELVARLPSYYSNKWLQNAKKVEAAKGEYAFDDLVEFVQKTSSDANHPVFSHEALTSKRREIQKDTKHEDKKFEKKKRHGALATSGNWKPNFDSPPKREKDLCLLCNKPHKLEVCDDFLKKTVKARSEFAKSKGLCFSCLQQGHMAKQCKGNFKCQTCKRPHATVLHYERKPKNDEEENPKEEEIQASSNCVRVCHISDCQDMPTSSLIMPVWIRHQDNPRKTLTYAVLDDQSDTCFITESVCRELGVKGPETVIELGTMHAVQDIKTQKISGLVISPEDKSVDIPLPKSYSREQIPVRRDQIPTAEMAKKWDHLRPIANKIPSYRADLSIGLLIGNNCVQGIKPRDVVPGKPRDPYAIRTVLGWGIIGATNDSGCNQGKKHVSNCNRICTRDISSQNTAGLEFISHKPTKEVINPVAVRKVFEQDFSEKETRKKPLSQEDRKFMAKTTSAIHISEDGHYELPLPFREDNVSLPYNRTLAESRLGRLERRFANDARYKNDYVNFIQDMIEKGYAEKVPKVEENAWYIPHHGVYHPRKPKKIRVVFDCSAKYHDESLNRHLLQGPDLTNTLTGVLCRFRQDRVAFTCDIEAMFHQVRVNEEHRDCLRFLWWTGGDTSKEPDDYRMTVHLFGATSSPGCSNLALKTTADDNEEEFGSDAAKFLRNDFYVDDGLKSNSTVKEATALVKNSVKMCQKGGFHLHKFLSNERRVIESVAAENRAAEVKELDLDRDVLPMDRVLGVQWCIETDDFQFRITLKDRPLTRRGILATVGSIYDPLGFVAPVLLTGKGILQLLCKANADWDDPLPEELRIKWERWRTDIHLLEKIKIPRCFKSKELGSLRTVELHHFSDASTDGYGQCSYLRLTDEENRVQCSLVMGKSRVAPLKQVSIPRLELTAALVSVKISETLQNELDYDKIEEIYWTDSKVVLGYINNEARRFHVFVANRVQQIRDHTNPDQWHYVESKINPADDASRGLKASEIITNSRWITGPDFLYEQRENWGKSNQQSDVALLHPEDVEVKKSSVFSASIKTSDMIERLEYFSSWFRTKRAVAVCLRYSQLLLARVRNKKIPSNTQPIEPNRKYVSVTVEEMEVAEQFIIKLIQKQAFSTEINSLKQNRNVQDGATTRRKKETVPKASTLTRLDPFIDVNGVIRVGGRIRNASIDDKVKYPIILPKEGHIPRLVARHFHERVKHQGRGITMNEIRSSGFWLIGGKSIVAKLIRRCTTCQRLRATTKDQKMAELPKERLEESPPFTYSAVDYFGPWLIKQGRKVVKRYGVLFTCLSSRAIHLEVSDSLETDSFLNAFRRFICRRGPIRQLRSDCGTNFVGASVELRKCLKEMDQERVKAELLKENCDWFEFKFNIPKSSHMGGVWERQIRTVRSVLNALLHKNGDQLNDESLCTFMCEAEAIVNSRPLTVDNMNSPRSLEPLTPNHLLTMKSKIVLPPPGAFQTADMYLRKHWRRVQHLSNEFWTRWRKEFMLSLQERQKWLQPRRNFQVDDVVVVKEDDMPRNRWSLARVLNAEEDEDGLVRKVKLLVGDTSISKEGKRAKAPSILDRPIHKLVLLLPSE